jgi:hypothetical protein
MKLEPAIYEHAAKVIDQSPWAVSRDSDLMAMGHICAHRIYGHSPIIVGIDIYNLEPEAYGAQVERPDSEDGIPAIRRHPFESLEDIGRLDELPIASRGRIPMILEAGRKVARACPSAEVKIPVSGPFSIASNLLGFERLLLSCIEQPDQVQESLFRLVRGQLCLCSAVQRAGLHITLFDSAVTPPLLSPRLFRKIVLPCLRLLVKEASRMFGSSIACIIGGNTLPILEAILETKPGYVICPFETDQAPFMERMREYPEIMVRLNMDAGVFTRFDREEINREAERVIAIAGNRRRVSIGTGALPYEADPRAVEYAAGFIEEATSHRV